MKKQTMVAALLAAIAGALRGIHEGMIMSRKGDRMHTGTEPGVRGHRWFELYHLIAGTALALFGALVWWLSRMRSFRLPFDCRSGNSSTTGCRSLRLRSVSGGLWFGLGLALIIWEATEAGYSLARSGTIIAAVEHINFADIVSLYIAGPWVWILHIARASAGVALILTGGET